MKMTVKVCLSIGTEDLEGAADDGAAWKAGAPGARYEAAEAGKGCPSREKGKAGAPGARGEAGDAGLRALLDAMRDAARYRGDE